MNEKFFVIKFIVGIIVALIKAFIMFHASVFEKNNSGIATIIGLIGICLIASSHIWSIKN